MTSTAAASNSLSLQR